MNARISRRAWLRNTGGSLTGFLLHGCVRGRSIASRPWPFPSYADPVTGAVVYCLTPGAGAYDVIYQTHPMWTPGMRHLVLNARLDGAAGPYAVEMGTGDLRRVVREGSVGAHVLRRDTCELFYMAERELCLVDVLDGFAGRGGATRLGALPSDVRGLSGGMFVDAAGEAVYMGVEFEPGERWGIVAYQRSTGQFETYAAVEFQVGHVQANPQVSGQILFCHETGGDAPQRMWIVERPGAAPRAFYRETFGEWVTHEAWWGADRVIFTIWPFDDEHRALPHGVAWVRVGEEQLQVVAQYAAWHTQGSPDRRWVMGDDFDRNVWLIDPGTHERRLLTQGHNGAGFNTHPHASFTPDSGGVVFNSSRNGAAQVFLATLPAWGSLPKA